MSITKSLFGTMPDGTPVDLYVLSGENGLSAEVIALGCRIVRLSAPDREGKCVNVVLGYDTLAEYVENRDYQGTAVGRYANRIGGASFSIDGKTYSLAKNDGENSLHGGPTGFAHRVWTVKESGDTPDGPSITFSYTSVDGEEGFPGTLTAEVTYTVTKDNALRIAYHAVTDATTPVNLTNHAFFNLTGDASRPILSHELQIHADKITAVREDLIPTGEYITVAGTPYDFNTPKTIGRDMGADDAMLKKCGGYDHNFVINGEGLRKAAEVYEPESGRVMEVYTDLPGMQLYTANSLSGKGHGGVSFIDHGALCLETQFFPDSPNHPEFPFRFLKPGESFDSVTTYRFLTR